MAATTPPYSALATVTDAGATAGTQTTALTMADFKVSQWAFVAAIFVLDVSAAATEANDTLDLQVQTLVEGDNWVPVCSFTQVLGNGGAVVHVGKISKTEPQAMFANSAALAAGSVRNIFGSSWRTSYVIVDPTGTNAAFSFIVRGAFF